MGYDLALFQCTVDDNLVCDVCHNVFEAAVMGCPQGHTFCSACLNSSQSSLGSKCPTCGVETGMHVPAPCLPIQSMANMLPVRCTGLADGELCDWTGSLKEYNHHRGRCELALLVCSYSGCSVICPRRHMRSHQKSCEHKPMMCQLCGDEFHPTLLQVSAPSGSGEQPPPCARVLCTVGAPPCGPSEARWRPSHASRLRAQPVLGVQPV